MSGIHYYNYARNNEQVGNNYLQNSERLEKKFFELSYNQKALLVCLPIIAALAGIYLFLASHGLLTHGLNLTSSFTKSLSYGLLTTSLASALIFCVFLAINERKRNNYLDKTYLIPDLGHTQIYLKEDEVFIAECKDHIVVFEKLKQMAFSKNPARQVPEQIESILSGSYKSKKIVHTHTIAERYQI